MVHAGLFQCFHNALNCEVSLTCVCDLFACVYTRGTSVYSLIRSTFEVESAQNLTPEKGGVGGVRVGDGGWGGGGGGNCGRKW